MTEPAMSAVQWRQGYQSDDLTVYQRHSMATQGPRVYVNAKAQPLGGGLGDERDIHALAAMCLHGQPFGFTWEDVDMLERLSEQFDAYQRTSGETADDIAPLLSLAQRIAALLPPREGV